MIGKRKHCRCGESKRNKQKRDEKDPRNNCVSISDIVRGQFQLQANQVNLPIYAENFNIDN